MSKCESCGAGLQPGVIQCQYCGVAVAGAKREPRIEDLAENMKKARALLDQMMPAPFGIVSGVGPMLSKVVPFILFIAVPIAIIVFVLMMFLR